jgi:hypothetical protein
MTLSFWLDFSYNNNNNNNNNTNQFEYITLIIGLKILDIRHKQLEQ